MHRMDKMTMAASIEARVPFLDHRLVEWALRVPPEAKLRRFTNKYLVRGLIMTLLPSPVIRRRKSGFGVPIGQRDYLEVRAVRSVVSEHLKGTRDHGEG